MKERQRIHFRDLGRLSFREAWEIQENLLQSNVAIKMTSETRNQAPTSHYLLFVEHYPVFTLGKSGKSEHVLISGEEQERLGIEFFRINRGGDITFHGPGQLVVYPIFDLEKMITDIGLYLRNLEEVIIGTLRHYGIESGRSRGETGVWLDPEISARARKICAIGIRSSRWITMHGLAFNVNTDLRYFDYIVPCGISDKQVTSLQREMGHPVDMEEVKKRVKTAFEEVFHAQLEENPDRFPAGIL